MTHNLLLEIGLEELPARFVLSSQEQLKKRMEDYLNEKRLGFESIKAYSTPRRLAVLVKGVSEKQADMSEHVKGPAKRIALDEEGNWTKAAQGFARGQGASVEEISFEDVDGEAYVFIDKFTAGLSAEEVLTDLGEIVLAMQFPINMRWGRHKLEYIRPFHWFLALLDDQVIDFSLLDVQSGNRSRGHRFIGQETTVEKAELYEEALEAESVIVDREKRQAMIVDQLRILEEENDFKIEENQDLLDEVTDLLEYPTAFFGQFDPAFLSLPEEVLITAMRDHQRYFAVRDQEGQLLPVFVSVRNGNRDHLDKVAQGNEKVISARLEDAVFFYEEDQKLDTGDIEAKLDQLTFHDKIGKMSEKADRLAIIVDILGRHAGLDEEVIADAKAAAKISKYDLVTNMVDEFPELQGVMGEKYALIRGEKPTVATAVREHYLPKTAEGDLPETEAGTLLSMADKIDNLLVFFAADLIPSGSNDPYALRRQAYALLRMLLGQEWDINSTDLLLEIEEALPETSTGILKNLSDRRQEVFNFILSRVNQVLEGEGIPHDVIEAVSKSDQENLRLMVENGLTLAQKHQDDNFKEAIESLARVANLVSKAEEIWPDQVEIKPELFESESEKALASQVADLQTKLKGDISSKEYFESLIDLKPAIDNFFEENLVMADDQAVKANRLALIKEIHDLVIPFAEVKSLVIK